MTRHRLALSVVTCAFVACRPAEPLADSSTTAVTDQVPSADGVPIAYEVRGTGDPAIVLVHGWTNDRRIWGQHPVTLARTHRVVALDLAGHGISGDGRDQWTTEAFGEDVAAVVTHLGIERVVLVGFSMGGQVSVEAARRLPGRVIGIVFVDTFHEPEDRLPGASVEQLEAAIRAGWGDTAFVRGFAFTPDAPDSIVHMATAQMAPELREHWFPALRGAHEWRRTKLPSVLDSVDVPMAAINTTPRPTNVEAWRRHDSTFTVDTLQGVGHAGILLQRVEDFDARLLALVERFARAAAVR